MHDITKYSRDSLTSQRNIGGRVIVFEGKNDTKLHDPIAIYSTITIEELFYCEPTCLPKDAARAFIPSAFNSHDARVHKVQREYGEFWVLTADQDEGDTPFERMVELAAQFAEGALHRVHTSASSRPGHGKHRAYIMLHEKTGALDWYEYQTAFHDFLEANGVKVDRSLALPAQPVFLPNVPGFHTATQTPLRGPEKEPGVPGDPLYYRNHTSGSGGLGMWKPTFAKWVEAARARLDAEAAEREAKHQRIAREGKPPQNADTPIGRFCAQPQHALDVYLPAFGYEQNPRKPQEWRSRYQQSGSYATFVHPNGKWSTLSESDANAGLGEACPSGRFGDAFDLLVHYGHGGDQNSAFAAIHKHEEALEVKKLENPDEWPEPVDLWVEAHTPTFPKGILPPELEHFVNGMAEVVGADPTGYAMACLTVCAAAIPDSIKIRPKSEDYSWREAARLWTMLIGPPSTRKSPLLKQCWTPLDNQNSQRVAEYQEQMAEYSQMTPQERRLMDTPRQNRSMLYDTTIEAAQNILQYNPQGLLLGDDELSGWFATMDDTSSKAGAIDRAFWLKSYDGGARTIDRVKRGTFLIPNVSVSLLGGIQIEPLLAVMNKAVDDGLIQRFIPVVLRPARGGLNRQTHHLTEPYKELVLRLNATTPTIFVPSPLARTLFGYREPWPLDVTLCEHGEEIRATLEREHDELGAAFEQHSKKLSAHIGKYNGMFARIVLTLHCIDHAITNGPEMPVPAIAPLGVVQRAARFMREYLRAASIAFYSGQLGLVTGDDKLQAVAMHILNGELPEVSSREIQKGNREARGMTANAIREQCERLESLGWVAPTTKDKPTRWMVNPKVHALYRKKAVAEQARRQRVQELIAASLPKA